ncbi:uncharacterized protein K02A2.6-like [Galendromus occidentalis]|uniref:RNA-directed DNA polymerase n=1 Tax=Galendromus occidentalis TaxID=34638 RepID=A0AAJ7L4E3_9ACAR|nr:uncharacterized protein K02A2.6-like [Galendromus occidentalis]
MATPMQTQAQAQAQTHAETQAQASAQAQVMMQNPMQGILPNPVQLVPSTTIVNVTPPPQLDVDSADVNENWKDFKSDFQIYTTVTRLQEQGEAIFKATFLSCLGVPARRWLKGLGVDVSAMSANDIKEEIDKRCTKKSTKTLLDFKFWGGSLIQREGESFDMYLGRVRQAATACRFMDVSDGVSIIDRLIRSQLIIGLKDKELQRELLLKDASLNRIIEKCQSHESSKRSQTVISKAESEQSTVAGFQPQRRPTGMNGGWNNKHGRAYGQKQTSTHRSERLCFLCGKPGHFKKECYLRTQDRRKKVFMIQEDGKDSDVEDGYDEQGSEMFAINAVMKMVDEKCAVRQIKASTSKWKEIVKIGNEKVMVVIDTGAECSVLPNCLVEQLIQSNHNVKRMKTTTKLISYFGDEHATGETITMPLAYRKRKCYERFYVVKEGLAPTISGDAAETIGLIKRIRGMSENPGSDQWIKRFPKVFQGVGEIKGVEVQLRLKENCEGHISPCRRIPVAYEDSVKQELRRMLQKGVIAKVSVPTLFVSNIVVVPKANGKIRLCLDPQHLNRALRRGPHPIKRFEQIQCKLNKAAYFTTLDANESFWQLKLDTASSYLCTFTTPWGRFRFMKLPFGILTATDEFQRATDDLFGDMPGVVPYIDDLIVWGNTKEEHDERVKQVLERCSRVGMVLNPGKCHFSQTSVKYLGHILTRQGFHIDPERIRIIEEVEAPQSKKEIQRFLGMVNFVGQFVEGLSEKTRMLRQLVKDDVVFEWTQQHQEAFEGLKRCLVSAPVLRYFDPGLPVVLSVDSSEYAVGACLFQEGKPVAYSSKALTQAQKKIPQIEKEMIAIVNGCAKYRYYLGGHPDITVETDHKPLENIFKKAFDNVPCNLQGHWLNLQRYGLKVTYRPGKEIPVADFLSRLHPKEQVEPNIHVKWVASLAISQERHRDYEEATRADASLTALKNLYERGWPSDKKLVPIPAQQYWPYREEIHCQDGLVLRSNRIVVPQSKRAEVLSQLHSGHSGIEKMKLKARPAVYWPAINADIERKVKTCHLCQQHHRQVQKEPLIQGEIPRRPWEIVSADVLFHEGKYYQVIVDHYSFFLEVTQLSDLSAKQTIKALWEVFQRHGYPREFRSDNGTNYASHEVKALFKEYDIKHTTSSPMYAKSNGMAERGVQEVKKILMKVKFGTPQFYNTLLEIRATPRTEALGSPAQRLMSRQPRTTLPCHESLLDPQVKDPKIVQEELKKERDKQKFYHDRTARARPSFKVNDGPDEHKSMFEQITSPYHHRRGRQPKGYNQLNDQYCEDLNE